MLPSLSNKDSAGGLGVAILDSLAEYGGVWYGWSGELTTKKRSPLNIEAKGKITFATLDLHQHDYEDFYNGYSNESLWPLFHYRLDLVEYSRKNYSGYLRVNKTFANNIIPLLKTKLASFCQLGLTRFNLKLNFQLSNRHRIPCTMPCFL